MRWNGIVSQPGHTSMAATFAPANASQAASSRRSRRKPIPRIPHRLDRRVRSELPAQPPDADVDHVGAGVEVISPHLREQPLPAHDLAGMLRELVQEAELAVREVADVRSDAGLATGEVEHEDPGVHDARLPGVRRPPELRADSGDQLVERERLRQVVARAERESPQLGAQVRARREDDDGDLGSPGAQLAQDAEAVEAGEEEVEHDEVVAAGDRPRQAIASVPRDVDRETLRLDPAGDEGEDSQL